MPEHPIKPNKYFWFQLFSLIDHFKYTAPTNPKNRVIINTWAQFIWKPATTFQIVL